MTTSTRLPVEELITKAKERVEKATIRVRRLAEDDFPDRDIGLGVLVPGGYILTVAHNINWDGRGRMILGELFVEHIRTSDNKSHIVTPCAVEPLSDIAAFEAVDHQDLYEQELGFKDFCQATDPVPISEDDFKLNQPIRVHVLSHKNYWIVGEATRRGLPSSKRFPSGLTSVTFDERIESGTSGGPVIDDSGLLVGVFSNSDRKFPRPHLALPIWIWKRIIAAQRSADRAEQG